MAGQNQFGEGTGSRKHSLRAIYDKMLDRCSNKNNPSYARYGGRGITVCERWSSGQPLQKGFWNFVEDMGDRPEGYSVERVDNDKGYEPSNCVWASTREQASNRRNGRAITGVAKHQTGWRGMIYFNGHNYRHLFHTQEKAVEFREKSLEIINDNSLSADRKEAKLKNLAKTIRKPGSEGAYR